MSVSPKSHLQKNCGTVIWTASEILFRGKNKSGWFHQAWPDNTLLSPANRKTAFKINFVRVYPFLGLAFVRAYARLCASQGPLTRYVQVTLKCIRFYSGLIPHLKRMRRQTYRILSSKSGWLYKSIYTIAQNNNKPPWHHDDHDPPRC
jgi:hypothetical protein